jgi:MFS family permease
VFSNKHPFLTALSLALGSAIALGLARFSYGLLLPVMREDLDWSYLVAGTMNTANALGYFIGALSSPAMMRRMTVHQFFISSAVITGIFLFLSGCTDQTSLLFIYRVIAGIASAWIFVAGGVLISQLGTIHANKSGLMLGIFYAGPGLGIVLSSAILPFFNDLGVKISWDHSWQLSWYALGILCLIFTLILIKPISSIPAIPPKPSGDSGTPLKSYAPALMGYFMFGVGYIGYMTFVVALLKQLGLSNTTLNIFHQDFRMNAVVYQVLKHKPKLFVVCRFRIIRNSCRPKVVCPFNLSTEREIKSVSAGSHSHPTQATARQYLSRHLP